MNKNIFTKIKRKRDKIIIEIPYQELYFSQIFRDQSYKILDNQKMLDWISENMLEVEVDDEIHLTAWENFINKLFDRAYRDYSQDWIVKEK